MRPAAASNVRFLWAIFLYAIGRLFSASGSGWEPAMVFLGESGWRWSRTRAASSPLRGGCLTWEFRGHATRTCCATLRITDALDPGRMPSIK